MVMLWIYLGYFLAYVVGALVYLFQLSQTRHVQQSDVIFLFLGIPAAWLLLGGAETMLADDGWRKVIRYKLNQGRLSRTKLVASGLTVGAVAATVGLIVYFAFPNSMAAFLVAFFMVFFGPLLPVAYYGRAERAG